MEAGFSNVFALKGGFQRWRRLGYPLESKGAAPDQPAPG
jgi:3-mercaptopyruvate sulfurtransferase SseA